MKMNEKHTVHMYLTAEDPAHVRVWEMIQDRDKEKYPSVTEYVMTLINREPAERKDNADRESVKGIPDSEFRKWEKVLLDDMEKKFRIIPRGPVGK